jgi:NTP pyrophosphatase (non-canonical NTP hydrolase)
MTDILKRIKKIIGLGVDDSNSLFLHISEEVGEVATCLHNKIRPRKQLKESSAEECVDVILCTIGLFYEQGGTDELFEKTVAKKLAKWEARIEKTRQEKQGKNK